MHGFLQGCAERKESHCLAWPSCPSLGFGRDQMNMKAVCLQQATHSSRAPDVQTQPPELVKNEEPCAQGPTR